jgi:hypothetical protein
MPLLRTTRTPHPLQEPILLRQPIQTVVALGSTPHKAAERVHLVLACVSAVLVDFADADLDGGVVFGFDDAVGCAAFAGDVAGGIFVSGFFDALVDWYWCWWGDLGDM